MNAPHGNLDILREYTCGCIVYRDEAGHDFTERGLWCCGGDVDTCPHYPQPCDTAHGRQLVRGIETQPELFT